jgi:hypothetical protein
MLLSAKNIINKSIELFKRDFRVWSPYLIVMVVSALLSSLFGFNPTFVLFFNTFGIPSSMVWMLSAMTLLLLSIFNIWLNLVLVRTVHERIFDQKSTGLIEKFRQTRHLLARNIGIVVLFFSLVSAPFVIGFSGFTLVWFENAILGHLSGVTALYLLFAFALLMLYGIIHFAYFSVRYAFSYYLVAIDEKKITEGLHQGNFLTEGRRGKIFWRMAFPGVVFLLIYVLATNILGAVSVALNNTFFTSFAGFISLLVSAVSLLLINISMVILFEDVKAKPLSVSPPKD